MRIAVFFISLFFVQMSLANTEVREFSANDLDKLRVKNSSGSVKVVATDRNQIKVTSEKIDFGDHCKLDMRTNSGELSVEVSGEGWFINKGCEVNLTFFVPKSTSIKIQSGSGALSIVGTKGDVDVRGGSGSIAINAEVKNLDARTGSGAVQILGQVEKANVRTGSGAVVVQGLTGTTDVRTGSGAVSLIYGKAPEKGKLSVKTGSGSTSILMPSDTKLVSDFKTGSGSILNELSDTEGAAFALSVRSGSGSVKVKKL